MIIKITLSHVCVHIKTDLISRSMHETIWKIFFVLFCSVSETGGKKILCGFSGIFEIIANIDIIEIEKLINRWNSRSFRNREKSIASQQVLIFRNSIVFSFMFRK